MSAKSFQICKFIKILVLQRGNIFSESWRGKFNKLNFFILFSNFAENSIAISSCRNKEEN